MITTIEYADSIIYLVLFGNSEKFNPTFGPNLIWAKERFALKVKAIK